MYRTFGDIPGYNEDWLKAYSQARYSQDAPVTGIKDVLCGVVVRYPTIRDLVYLDMIGSSTLVYGKPLAKGEALFFLWLLSRWFAPTPAHWWGWPLWFCKRLAFNVVVGLYLRSEHRMKQVRQFADLCLCNGPTAGGGGKTIRIKAPLASAGAILSADMAHFYGGDPGQYLDSPVPLVFQWLNIAKKRANPKAVFTPLEIQKVESKYLRLFEEARKEAV